MWFFSSHFIVTISSYPLELSQIFTSSVQSLRSLNASRQTQSLCVVLKAYGILRYSSLSTIPFSMSTAKEIELKKITIDGIETTCVKETTNKRMTKGMEMENRAK